MSCDIFCFAYPKETFEVTSDIPSQRFEKKGTPSWDRAGVINDYSESYGSVTLLCAHVLESQMSRLWSSHSFENACQILSSIAALPPGHIYSKERIRRHRKKISPGRLTHNVLNVCGHCGGKMHYSSCTTCVAQRSVDHDVSSILCVFLLISSLE